MADPKSAALPLGDAPMVRFAHSIGSLRLFEAENGPERVGPYMNALD